jgi:hypothetical protein
MKIIKDIKIDDYTVTIKEDRNKKRWASFSNLWGSTRYALHATDKMLQIEYSDAKVKLPIIPLAHALHEIGIGETIWEELNKYYGKNKN